MKGCVMKKAAWNHWSQMRTARLWECVALSLNIDPRTTSLEFLKSRPHSYDLDRQFLRERAEFQSRLDIALSHDGHDPLLEPDHRYPSEPHSEFRLAEFAAWAMSFNWPIPHEMAELAESAEKAEAKVEQGALHPRERDTLLKLVIGMAMDSYRYDPAAPRSKVPAEIAADLEKKGITVTDDTIRKWLKQAAETVLPAKPQKP